MKRLAGLIFVVGFAQATATAAWIGGMSLFNKTHPDREAWAVLLPCLLAGFIAELLTLVIGLRWIKESASLWMISWVITGWLAGLVSFLTWNEPRIAWLVTAGATVLLLGARKRRRRK